MKLFNILFYTILFIGFFLPTNTSFYIPLPGILLSINELAFLLLPIVNMLCVSRESVFIFNKRLKNLIVLFFLAVLLAELFKLFAFNESLGGIFKSLRIGLPLFSSLILVWQGIRANIKIVWKVLLSAISVSVILSIVSIFVALPIYFDLEGGQNVLTANSGRLINANSGFGIIGLYLLFKDKDKWFNEGKLPLYTSIFSIVSLVLAFNRTYLALLLLTFAYLAFTTFRLKNAFKLLMVPVLVLGAFIAAYNLSPAIQHQVDRRILSIVKGKTTIEASTIEGNRDFIYEGIGSRIEEGYWILGLPYKKAIFHYYNPNNGIVGATKTDISLINILLRNGFFALVLFILILFRIIKIRYGPPFIIVIYLLASLNIDALYNHNSILFLFLFGLVYTVNLEYHRLGKQKYELKTAL